MSSCTAEASRNEVPGAGCSPQRLKAAEFDCLNRSGLMVALQLAEKLRRLADFGEGTTSQLAEK
jgi:hypothetical protein